MGPMRPVRGLARAILGGLFVAAGSHGLLNPGRHEAAAAPLADQLAPLLKRIDPRIPTETRTLVRINGAVQVGAGLMLASGTAPRPAAALLAATLIPTTVAQHPFWRAQSVEIRRAEQVQFAKNMGLLAGLILAAADTGGSPSLGWRTKHAVKAARKKMTGHS